MRITRLIQSRAFPLVALSAMLLGISGCSRGAADTQQQLAALKAEVAALRTDTWTNRAGTMRRIFSPAMPRWRSPAADFSPARIASVNT